MREPNILVLPQARDIIKLESLPAFEVSDWDLTEIKQLHKYFFTIERIVRNSHSYKKFINFLREYVDMNSCAFFENINNIDTTSIHIHVHHEPFTLFDIVNIVYAKRLALHEPLAENQVAKEVLWNHYRMAVGLIPLSETVHELVHNGFLFIPTTTVFGYYKKFYNDYEPFIEDSLKRTLFKNEQASMEYNFAKETKVLNMQMVFLDTTGAYELPKREDIVKLMKSKIEQEDKALEKKQSI